MKKNNDLVRITGYILFTISCLLFIMIPAVPLFDLAASKKAAISAGLLISGEILFYLSLAILGRSFYEKIKSKLKFRKPKLNDPEITEEKQQK